MKDRNFLAEMLGLEGGAQVVQPVGGQAVSSPAAALSSGLVAQDAGTLQPTAAITPNSVLDSRQALAASLISQSQDRSAHPLARGIAAYFGTKQIEDINKDRAKTESEIARRREQAAAEGLRREEERFNREFGLEERKVTLSEREAIADSKLKEAKLRKLDKEVEALAKGGVTDPKEAFKRANDLRDEFVKQSGEFVKQRDAIARIKASASDPSPAGDLALVFNYMKVLDPGSTVREGEFANAAKAGEFGDKISNAVSKVQSGEILTSKQRDDFVNRASGMFDSAKNQQEQLSKAYSGLADRFGVPTENVVLDLSLAKDADTGAVSGRQSFPAKKDGVIDYREFFKDAPN